MFTLAHGWNDLGCSWVLVSMTRRVALLFAVLASTLVGCDHATKLAAKAHLEGRPSVELAPGIFDLRYVENYDVGFSLLRGVPENVRLPLIITLGIASMALVAWHWRRTAQAARWPQTSHAAHALVLAGAAGNLLDRLARGYVVDFLHLEHWPVFNLADVFIVAGAGLLLLAHRPERPA